MIQLYKAIWGVSGSRQIVLILLAMSVAALAAAPLSYQKDIVNGLSEGRLDPSGLYLLCAGMMALILLSLGLKWTMSHLSSMVGEDIIRLIRVRVYTNAVTGASASENARSPGTLATIISAEAEELGQFAGSACSEPVVQIGTLISVIGFIAATQPLLGMIALLMILPQIVIVLRTQAHVNALVAQRVHILRRATQESLAANLQDFNQGVLDDFTRIYDTRRRIFIWKLSTKFVLSSLNGIGLVVVLALGGAMVLQGRTDVGTLVAATIGLGRIQGPTNFLIAFYRQVSATRVKYELLTDQTAA